MEIGENIMNEKIREARKIALKILKPSREELKRGMEIHANSVVIDAYGFAPRSALEGDKIRRAIENGASEIEIQDMMENMYTVSYTHLTLPTKA